MDDHSAEITLHTTELVAVVQDWERKGALLALAARRLEASGELAHDGTVSMRSWLRHHLKMTEQHAGELLSTGRFLDTYDEFAAAAINGRPGPLDVGGW